MIAVFHLLTCEQENSQSANRPWLLIEQWCYKNIIIIILIIVTIIMTNVIKGNNEKETYQLIGMF